MARVYESGMRGGEKPKRGEAESVEIKRAKNGYVVRCNYAGIVLGVPDQPSVFQSLDEALEHARQELERGRKETTER